MIGQWRRKFSQRELDTIEFISHKVENYPRTCSDEEKVIHRMASLLEQIHFAMAPLSTDAQFAIQTKEEIKRILGY